MAGGIDLPSAIVTVAVVAVGVLAVAVMTGRIAGLAGRSALVARRRGTLAGVAGAAGPGRAVARAGPAGGRVRGAAGGAVLVYRRGVHRRWRGRGLGVGLRLGAVHVAAVTAVPVRTARLVAVGRGADVAAVRVARRRRRGLLGVTLVARRRRGRPVGVRPRAVAAAVDGTAVDRTAGRLLPVAALPARRAGSRAAGCRNPEPEPSAGPGRRGATSSGRPRSARAGCRCPARHHRRCPARRSQPVRAIRSSRSTRGRRSPGRLSGDRTGCRPTGWPGTTGWSAGRHRAAPDGRPGRRPGCPAGPGPTGWRPGCAGPGRGRTGRAPAAGPPRPSGYDAPREPRSAARRPVSRPGAAARAARAALRPPRLGRESAFAAAAPALAAGSTGDGPVGACRRGSRAVESSGSAESAPRLDPPRERPSASPRPGPGVSAGVIGAAWPRAAVRPRVGRGVAARPDGRRPGRLRRGRQRLVRGQFGPVVDVGHRVPVRPARVAALAAAAPGAGRRRAGLLRPLAAAPAAGSAVRLTRPLEAPVAESRPPGR